MECDLEKGLEMRKWVLSGILATEETYLSHLEALLLVRHTHIHRTLTSWPSAPPLTRGLLCPAPAHEAPEGSSYHITACAHRCPDRNHLLQSA